MSKLLNTTRLCATLFLARTFGRYEHTVWNGEFEYHRYAWRGQSWAFPVSPIEQLTDNPPVTGQPKQRPSAIGT